MRKSNTTRTFANFLDHSCVVYFVEVVVLVPTWSMIAVVYCSKRLESSGVYNERPKKKRLRTVAVSLERMIFEKK